MIQKIAVIGTGAIGIMMGGFLSDAGYDVTVVSQFRREIAQLLCKDGIKVEFEETVIHSCPKAVYGPDLTKTVGGASSI